MRTVRNQNFNEKDLTDRQFWTGPVRFINCSFQYAYIGVSCRKAGAQKYDFSRVKFVDCDFLGCNFKGTVKLKPANFQNPRNILTTHHLPKSITHAFRQTACAYSDALRQRYRRANVINPSVLTVSSPAITGFFRAAAQNNNPPETSTNRAEAAPNP